MQRGFGELDEELWYGDGALLFSEEINHAFPPIFKRRVITMRSELFLYLFSLPLSLRNGELQKLDIMLDRISLLALRAVVIEAEGGLDGIVDQVAGAEHVLLVEEVPLIKLAVV